MLMSIELFVMAVRFMECMAHLEGLQFTIRQLKKYPAWNGLSPYRCWMAARKHSFYPFREGRSYLYFLKRQLRHFNLNHPADRYNAFLLDQPTNLYQAEYFDVLILFYRRRMKPKDVLFLG